MQKIKIIAITVIIFTSSLVLCMSSVRQALTPAKKQELRNGALIDAAENGDLEMVAALLPICQVNARSKPQGFSAMRQAAQDGHFDIVALLTHARADVNIEDADGCTPLSIACEAGRLRVVEFLLKNGAKRSMAIKSKKAGASPLRQASQGGHDAILDLLLKNGARDYIDIQDTRGMTPLFVASFNNHPTCVDLLLAAKANITIPTIDGFSPLQGACEKGNLAVAQKLVAADHDTIAAKTHDGMTPVYKASFHGHTALVKFLIKAKSDVTTPNKAAFIPLHAACSNGHVAIVRELIHKAGETINASKPQGITPLHVACYYAQQDVVALLLEKKADPTLVDINGKAPLDYAKTNLDLVTQFQEIIRASERQHMHSPEREFPAGPQEDGGPDAGEENGDGRNSWEEQKEEEAEECAV